MFVLGALSKEQQLLFRRKVIIKDRYVEIMSFGKLLQNFQNRSFNSYGLKQLRNPASCARQEWGKNLQQIAQALCVLQCPIGKFFT
jgi:hypothetical protein